MLVTVPCCSTRSWQLSHTRCSLLWPQLQVVLLVSVFLAMPGVRQRLGVQSIRGKAKVRETSLGNRLTDIYGQGRLSAGEIGDLASSHIETLNAASSSSAPAIPEPPKALSRMARAKRSRPPSSDQQEGTGTIRGWAKDRPAGICRGHCIGQCRQAPFGQNPILLI